MLKIKQRKLEILLKIKLQILEVNLEKMKILQIISRQIYKTKIFQIIKISQVFLIKLKIKSKKFLKKKFNIHRLVCQLNQQQFNNNIYIMNQSQGFQFEEFNNKSEKKAIREYNKIIDKDNFIQYR